jgi:hypothetical protein
MSNIRRVLVGAVAALALFTVACESGPTSLRTGKLSLLLTDAPGDVAEAVVTIDRIYLQPDSNDANGRVVLLEDDVTVDLLTLRDSLMGLIDSVDIPVGSYRQLRLVISGGYVSIVGTDTTTRQIYASSPTYAGLPSGAVVTGDLQMPSLAQSGLKVTLPDDALEIGDDDVVTLVIDFDVAQSFGRLAGNSGRWVMSPRLTATKPVVPPVAP